MSLNIETRKGPPERLMMIAAAAQARKARKTQKRPRPAAAPKPKTPRKRDRSSDAVRYHADVDKGLCVECRETEAKPGQRRCDECRVARNARQTKERQARFDAGLCVRCPNRHVDGGRMCEECRGKARDAIAAKRAANGRTA